MKQRALAIFLLALVCAGCGEEVVIRVSTRIWPQGGINRRVEIVGRDEKGEKPTEAGWLGSRVGVHLASRDSWKHVEETPGRILAEGFFPRAEDLPPTLAHQTSGSVVADHAEATITTEDLVVVKRWTVRETLSDPYGPNETATALDGVVGALTDFLREQVRDVFGDDTNLPAAEAFLRGEGKDLLQSLLPSLRQNKTEQGLTSAAAQRAWKAVLTRHAVPIDPGATDPFSGNQVELLSAWMRGKVAAALSTKETVVRPEDLTFWPGAESDETEDLMRRIEPLLPALAGYYGDVGGPSFRFESRLVVPGKLLRTNGTPDQDAVVWAYRDQDLAKGPRELKTESVELNEDALRGLGARRDLDAAALLELTDLLTERDPKGALRKLLADAVRRGQLKLLRDAEAAGENELLARELADLLDPALEREPLAP